MNELKWLTLDWKVVTYTLVHCIHDSALCDDFNLQW